MLILHPPKPQGLSGYEMPEPRLIHLFSCLFRPPARKAETLEFEDVEGSSRRGAYTCRAPGPKIKVTVPA